jgi:hypothetical protein
VHDDYFEPKMLNALKAKKDSLNKIKK